MQAYEQIQSHAPSFAQITDPVFNELCVVQTDILFPNVIHYSEHPKISPVLLNTATTVLTPIDAQALLTKYANELKSLHHTLTKDLGFMSLIALVHTLYDDMQTNAGATPVMVCMQKLATSLAQVYTGERDKLELPLPGLPLALASSLESN